MKIGTFDRAWPTSGRMPSPEVEGAAPGDGVKSGRMSIGVGLGGGLLGRESVADFTATGQVREALLDARSESELERVCTRAAPLSVAARTAERVARQERSDRLRAGLDAAVDGRHPLLDRLQRAAQPPGSMAIEAQAE